MVIMNLPPTASSLAISFFKPLLDLGLAPRFSRICSGISDSDYLFPGICWTTTKESTPAISAALRLGDGRESSREAGGGTGCTG